MKPASLPLAQSSVIGSSLISDGHAAAPEVRSPRSLASRGRPAGSASTTGHHPGDEFPLGMPFASIRFAAAERAPLRGTVRVVVVLVDFSDKPMQATTSHFNDLFFSTGVLPNGSVKEYFTEVTNGLVTLAGEVVGPYRMPETAAWYANGNFGIGRRSG